MGKGQATKMKCIIAGSRTVTDKEILLCALAFCPWTREITEVISGGAAGADALGEEWAKSQKLRIVVMEADWIAYGRTAGPRRNRDMARYAAPDGILIALWDGKSRGTENMIKEARTLHLKVLVWDAAKNRPWYEREQEEVELQGPALVHKFQRRVEPAAKVEERFGLKPGTLTTTAKAQQEIGALKRYDVMIPCPSCRGGEHSAVARIKDPADQSKTVAIVLQCRQCGHQHENTAPQAYRLVVLARRLRDGVDRLNRKYGTPVEEGGIE